MEGRCDYTEDEMREIVLGYRKLIEANRPDSGTIDGTLILASMNMIPGLAELMTAQAIYGRALLSLGYTNYKIEPKEASLQSMKVILPDIRIGLYFECPEGESCLSKSGELAFKNFLSAVDLNKWSDFFDKEHETCSVAELKRWGFGDMIYETEINFNGNTLIGLFLCEMNSKRYRYIITQCVDPTTLDMLKRKCAEKYAGILGELGIKDFEVCISKGLAEDKEHIFVFLKERNFEIEMWGEDDNFIQSHDYVEHFREIFKIIKESGPIQDIEFVKRLRHNMRKKDYVFSHHSTILRNTDDYLDVDKKRYSYYLPIYRFINGYHGYFIRLSYNTTDSALDYSAVAENKFKAMYGHQDYEKLMFVKNCVQLLKLSGYTDVVRYARGSLSSISAYRDGVLFRFECVCSNDPIKETMVKNAAKLKDKVNVLVVVTNNMFTDDAIELAKNENIILWDEKRLLNMIEKVKDDFNPITEEL